MEKIILKPTQALKILAQRYIWWNQPEWAFRYPDILIANIMNLGCWEDIQQLRQETSDNTLKQVLIHAPVGYFDYRSWDYWHQPCPSITKTSVIICHFFLLN